MVNRFLQNYGQYDLHFATYFFGWLQQRNFQCALGSGFYTVRFTYALDSYTYRHFGVSMRKVVGRRGFDRFWPLLILSLFHDSSLPLVWEWSILFEIRVSRPLV